MRRAIISAVLFAALLSAASADSGPPRTVPRVDLSRYTGTWYEIASFPQWFQRGCTGSQARYTLRKDGEIDVVNSCYRNGKVDTARGRAWVADPATNAKLKVSFFWPLRADYWIIDLGKDYEYAVVSAPSRKYLWILSRTPTMDAGVYSSIVDRLKDRGFDVSRLVPTPSGAPAD